MKWYLNFTDSNIYIQSETNVLHNIIIFTPVIYVGHSIIIEFGFFVDDLLNNKSPRGLLNRQNPFLWYELISHRMDPWKSENNNYDILENKLKH